MAATQTTSIEAYREHSGSGKKTAQQLRILAFITNRGGDWTIGELAKAMDLEKSTVSARLHELLHETKQLVAFPKRKDRVSGVTVRPVGFPEEAGQMHLPHFYSTGQFQAATSRLSGNSGTGNRSFSRGGL
jgi:hypothetical protein